MPLFRIVQLSSSSSCLISFRYVILVYCSGRRYVNAWSLIPAAGARFWGSFLSLCWDCSVLVPSPFSALLNRCIHLSLSDRPTDRTCLTETNRQKTNHSCYMVSPSKLQICASSSWKLHGFTLLFVDSYLYYTADINQVCVPTKMTQNRVLLSIIAKASTEKLISFSLVQIRLIAIAIMALMESIELLEGACWVVLSLCVTAMDWIWYDEWGREPIFMGRSDGCDVLLLRYC